MTETLKLPVLPLADSVVLPGMVVPVRLDEPEIQAAVDAAQSGSVAGADRKVIIVPRLDGRYAAVGTIAVLEQVGRLPNGEKAAVVRGEGRAQIGSGVTGPGAALWVEVTPVEDGPVTGRATELAKEYKALVVGILQQRGAWQVIDTVQQITDPGQLADTAGWALLPRPRAQGAAAGRDRRGQAAGAADRLDPRARGRAGGLGEDLQGRPRGHGEDPARVPAAPAAGRDPQGAGRGRARRSRRLPDPGRERRPARARAQGRADRGRQAGAGVATRARSRAGSGPGWTRCWTSRGTPAPTTTPTWPPPGPSWTPTTPAWTTSRSG